METKVYDRCSAVVAETSEQANRASESSKLERFTGRGRGQPR